MICAQADPDAIAHGRALFQAHAAADAAALAFADRDGRQPHCRACVRANAAPDAATISEADDAFAYCLARRSDNESRAPASRRSDADANIATVAAADAQT